MSDGWLDPEHLELWNQWTIGIPPEEWDEFSRPYKERIREINKQITEICIHYCKPEDYWNIENCIDKCTNFSRREWQELVPNWEEIIYGEMV